MTGKAKRKGDLAERQAADLLTTETGYEVKRLLGAGRQEDVGDLCGVPYCCIQVADWEDKSRACLQKPREVERQKWFSKQKFAASLIRWRGGHWRFVLTIPQFWKVLKAAIWAVEHGYKG